MRESEAKAFAIAAHEGQVRKMTGTPMIEHPIRVAEMLEKAGFDEDLIAAGYLHDTIEDTEVDYLDLVLEFGTEVAELVMGNTEDKTKTWEERKLHTIEWVAEAPLEIRALIVADKLDNLTSLVADYANLGEDLWKNFNRGYEKQKWYFKGVAENCMKGIEPGDEPEFFHTYVNLVNEFFK